MAKFPEQLNGGMVTSKDPSTLQPGEVQVAQECMFYQDNEHLSRVPGVTTWSTIVSTSCINGLTACRFEDGTQKLVAQVSASGGGVAYYMADAETNNSAFATVVTGLTGGQALTSVQYDNRHYLFNGVDDNLVLLKDGTVRPHGLKPTIAGGINWLDVDNALVAGPTATGFYEYWYTEVVKFSDGQELESAFNGDPVTYELTQLTSAPRFTLPGIPQNDEIAKKYGASKIYYNVYRSEKKLTAADKMYPIGRKCKEVSINSTGSIFVDTSTKTSTISSGHMQQPSELVGQSFTRIYARARNPELYHTLITATACASGGSVNGPVSTTVLSTANTDYIRIGFTKGASGWHDGTNGSWFTTTGSNNSDGWVSTDSPAYLMTLKHFNFGTIADSNISGVGVVVNGFASQSGIADIYVMPCKFISTGSRIGRPENIPAPGGDYREIGPHIHTYEVYDPVTNNNLSAAYGIFGKIIPASVNPFIQTKSLNVNSVAGIDLGFGASNSAVTAPAFLTGKYQWKLSDITDDFGVQILVVFKNLNSSTVNPYVGINSVEMYIEYNATSTRVTKDTKFYEAVTIETSGVQSAFGANKPGKIASTGTIFSGSLVTNSKEDPNRIFYSVPGFPDYFPTDVYWFELPGVDNDKITYIGTVNDRLVVGTRGSLWRINYLPSQDDASFARGQAVSLISNTVGIVNPTSACVFVNLQGQQELAFVDTNGVFSTDGYGIRKLSQDLLWVGPSNRAVFTSTSQTSPYTNVIGLVNDARTQTLRLLTTGGGWIGSYAAIHGKQGGGLKWTKYYLNYNKYSVVNGDHVLGACTVCSAACIRRVNGTWIVVYGMGPAYGLYTEHGGLIAREDSSDSTTYNNPMGYANSIYPQVLTREISPAGLTNEFSVDGLAIHGTLKSSLTSNAFYNVGAAITASQRQTNAAAVAASGFIPGGVAGSRMAYAGIDGVNGDSTALTIAFEPLTDGAMWEKVAGMFEIHAIILDVNDFGEVDTSA